MSEIQAEPSHGPMVKAGERRLLRAAPWIADMGWFVAPQQLTSRAFTYLVYYSYLVFQS
jgi:hypothetical protein